MGGAGLKLEQPRLRAETRMNAQTHGATRRLVPHACSTTTATQIRFHQCSFLFLLTILRFQYTACKILFTSPYSYLQLQVRKQLHKLSGIIFDTICFRQF